MISRIILSSSLPGVVIHLDHFPKDNSIRQSAWKDGRPLETGVPMDDILFVCSTMEDMFWQNELENRRNAVEKI